MNVRNVFTSATLYTQQVRFSLLPCDLYEAFVSIVENICQLVCVFALQTLPQTLRFPETPGMQYDWQVLPPPQLVSPKKTTAATRASKSFSNQLGHGEPTTPLDEFDDLHSSIISENSPSPAKNGSQAQLPSRTVFEKSSPATREHNLHRDRNSILARVSDSSWHANQFHASRHFAVVVDAIRVYILAL